MYEEYAIYRDYQKAFNYLEQQKQRIIPVELKAIKIMPESDEPFSQYHDFEKCYDNPETQQQLHELERYGYFYKKINKP